MWAQVRRRLAGVAATAERRTRDARSRLAEAVFFGEPVRTGDRIASQLYFSVFSGVWGDLAGSAEHLAPFNRAIAALPPELAPRLIVDVGTGAGASAAMLARRWPEARVEGVDVSRRMVRLAARLHDRPNLVFRQADVVRLPYPAASVDLVTCVNAIVDPVEIRRILAPTSRLVMASTWFPLRDASSTWVTRFQETGFVRTDSAGIGDGSWELWRLG